MTPGVYLRGNFYVYDFILNGRRYRGSTRIRKGHKVDADAWVEALRTDIARGVVNIGKRKPVPTLREFDEVFTKSVETKCADKPATIQFYKSKAARLLEFSPLGGARLDQIDEALIESYVQHRRKAVAPGSVNRELATLRKALRLAHEWKLTDRVPRIRLLPGERVRDFVLSHEAEQTYWGGAPQPLRDFAILALDTGVRVSEGLSLQWPDVHLEPVNGARLGYLRIRSGKSKNAQRNLSLTARVRSMLEARRATSQSLWVFTAEDRIDPLSVFTLESQHARRREALKLSRSFVIHSLRHTFGTRLGESGADAFTIMRIMGHSTVTVSQRYVHPTPESLERAFERLELMNKRTTHTLPAPSSPTGVPTISTTASRMSDGPMH